MGTYYYFYKSIDEEGNPKERIDDNKWAYMPNSEDIIKYGAKRVEPKCNGCEYENNKKLDNTDENYFSKIPCYECLDRHTTYRITKGQAIQIQNEMTANNTLFTEMMAKADQDYIYLRYDY